MAWIMGTYAMTLGHSAHGVVTGKPISIGGSEGRGEATARGLLYVVEEACKLKKISLRGATVAIQGFGNAGATAARLFATVAPRDRKSTRLNSSHSQISYAVFCLKKKKRQTPM